MPRLFRNGLLVLVVVLGALAFGLHFAAGSVAARLSTAFTPIASLSYGSAGFSWDGRLLLRAPRLEVREGLWRGVVEARTVYLGQASPFWLIGESLFSDQAVPATLNIEALGLKLPGADAENKLAPWIDATTLAPFEIQGCGSDALNAKDRARMGAPVAERRDRLTYAYDDAARRLELKLDLESPGIAHWQLSSRFLGFSPTAWSNLGSQPDLRVEHAELLYDDPGYLGRRNAFCAQWLGVPVNTFIERHTTAIDTLLATHGIVPSSDVRSLYRELVSKGGKLQLISLPDSAWMPSEVDAYPRSELLRLLNITARRSETQPIMLRLVFHEPEQPLLFTVTAPVDGFAEDALAEIVSPDMTTATQSAPPRVTSIIETPHAVSPARAETVVPALTAHPSPPRTGSATPTADLRSIRPDLPSASAPLPPANSTLAMVWKPGVIERLKPATSAPADDPIISARELGNYIGQRVRLQTSGGRRLDGRVSDVDKSRLILIMQSSAGTAELNVPLSNISEARLVRPRGSAD